MKKLLVILILTFPAFCFGQSANSLLTTKHAGEYSWASKNAGGAGGQVIVYPESNSTILFYLYQNRGEPSFNMGELYGRVTITNGTGVFFNKDYPGSNCKFRLTFIGEKLTIETLESKEDCGFGGGVYADGEFTRTSAKIPEYFEGIERKVYFKTTKPEQYNKF
jgi:hypothetical protein